jgi:hypothetical protein
MNCKIKCITNPLKPWAILRKEEGVIFSRWRKEGQMSQPWRGASTTARVDAGVMLLNASSTSITQQGIGFTIIYEEQLLSNHGSQLKKHQILTLQGTN